MVIWIILALRGVWCFWLTLDGCGAGLGLKQIVELMDNQIARLNARVKALEDRFAVTFPPFNSPASKFWKTALAVC
jgi:hypothetical protein